MKKAAILLLLCFLLSLAAGCGKPDQPKMATLDDLANKKIGVYTGTIYDKFAVERFPAATILRYNHSTDFPLALKTGKVDAAISNLYSAKTLIKANPEVGILTDDVLNFPIGIGFNKNNPALRERFNAFLKSIKADGSYDVMYKRWFDGDADNAVMPKFPAVTGGEKVTLAVATGDMPNVGFVNGEYVGFDIELVQTFAQKENIQLNIISMEFGALIAALAVGKVDMIADCIAITEERKKQVDFSDPYMEDKSAIIVLQKNMAKINGAMAPIGVAPKEKEQQVSFVQSVKDGFYNNIIHENRYLLILDGLKITGIISAFSILFGTLLGAFICFLRMSRRKTAILFAKIYISIVRGVPVLVLLMILYYVVFAKISINPIYVAVIAFGINFAAYVSEMFRSAIESIDKGQTEAGIANGFSKVQTFVYIVMPQAVKQVLPVYKGELISLVKATSIVGYIAVQDLTKASDIIRSRTFDAFFPLLMTALLYFAISWLLLLLLEIVEKRTDPKQKKRQAISSKPQPFKQGVVVAAVLIAVAVTLSPSTVPSSTQNSSIKNEPITKLSDLNGKRISVITGTTGDFAVREKFKSAQVLDMLYPADAALAVKSKKADAFVFDKSTLQYIVLKNKDEFELLPEKLASVDIAIPMRLNDRNLHNKINSALSKFREDGTLDAMYKRWFIEQQTVMPKIPLNGSNGSIKMATCLLQEPFAFVSNGEMKGFDIELAYRIAADMGVQLEISDMPYDAMIAALASNTVDIAIANFYKIEEREQKFEFSIPYLTNDISAMVRSVKR